MLEPGMAIAAIPFSQPRKSNMKTEEKLQALGQTAPHVTPADIEASITGEHYFTAADGVCHVRRAEGFVADPRGPLPLLTFCVLVLRNGFTVTGESACASPENFDAQIGREIARDNAVRKIWPLLGFVLLNHLTGPEAWA